MALRKVSLDDKYVAESGQVFMTGIQALVRLPMLQQRRDERAGLTTGTFISGYRRTHPSVWSINNSGKRGNFSAVTGFIFSRA